LKNGTEALSSVAGLPGEGLKSLFAAIVESSDDAIISKDLNGVITSWNPAATRLFGYSAEEMIGQPVLRLFPDELKHEEELTLSRLRAGETSEHHETIRVDKNGRRLQVSLTTSPIKDSQGRVIGGSTIVRDISRQKTAEEARLRLAAIVESSDDAIVSKDLNGIVTSWNVAATRLFGYEPEDIIGKSILTIIPPELHYQEAFILNKIRAGERLEHYETERLTKNGDRVQVSLTISPVKDDFGRVVGVSKIARDVTQRRQIEQALVQTEKLAATGRMAATIAHEINNPLEAVVNLIFLARNYPSLPEAVRGYLITAEKEIERVSLIARQTLGFYRETTTPVPLAIQEIIDDVLTVYESRFRSRGIRVETFFEPVRALTARKGEVAQIVSNLVANSIDAMPNGGFLRLEVRENSDIGNGIELVIQDQGTGIREKDLPHLFEPFFTTKKNVGTGLGLWIVKQFLQNHGATVSVSSNTDGIQRGTTFSMFFPFANPFDTNIEEAEQEEDEPSNWAPAGGERK
jgi:PAS domain S-box-containing protein